MSVIGEVSSIAGSQPFLLDRCSDLIILRDSLLKSVLHFVS